MTKTTNELLVELIDTLLHSATQEHDDGVVQHEHAMFDNIDRDRLDIIRVQAHKLLLQENK